MKFFRIVSRIIEEKKYLVEAESEEKAIEMFYKHLHRYNSINSPGIKIEDIREATKFESDFGINKYESLSARIRA